MTLSEIKVGLKFKEGRGESIYTITKVTDKMVFYNWSSYPQGAHQGKIKFLSKFNKFGAVVLN